ncbi:5-deoxy-glucuronate isomerase [Streptomyces goshikiensis]|uniref:5-deoxy-glucuronate isomerase n=1 Tax=Streptomyces goshikiensis TaxID=1942 RepID=UPI0033D31272
MTTCTTANGLTLTLTTLAPDEPHTTGADPGREHALVLLAGTLTSAGGTIDRDSPFNGPARGWYLPAGTTTAFTAGETGARIAYVSSPLPPGTPPTGSAPVLLGGPGAVVEVRGHGSWEREVTTLITPPLSVRLQLGETLARDGRWSTYPPHRHDTSNPPHETAMQEAFAFHLNPPTGFAVLLAYDDDHQVADATATVITDRALAAVDHGHHTLVGAGGHDLHYLWAATGEDPRLITRTDPAHAWIETTTPKGPSA